MTAQERGFLLLSSHLGNPERRVMTMAQLRTLAYRVQASEYSGEDRKLTEEDLVHLGYGREMAARILALLEEEVLLSHCLRRAEKLGCMALPRNSFDYPSLLRQRLGWESPGCLWYKGDVTLFNQPAISLVGSRNLEEANRQFAEAVGRYAAQAGLILISGNARVADRTAQEACLEAGGQVICFVADELCRQMPRKQVLYVSEEDFDATFSKSRALSRNRCIHTLGAMTFVAQADLGKGGTWDGTVRNLRHNWSPVICFRDGSDAVTELERMGAYAIGLGELRDFQVPPEEISLF